MKKQKRNFSKNRRTSFWAYLIILLSAVSPGIANAQDIAASYSFDGKQTLRDITVPGGYSYLYLAIKGADGGNSKKEGHKGGEGVHVAGYVTIGDGPGEIPEGSILRLIPGQAGGSDYYLGGGGGGTGVAFKGPGTNDTWELLMVGGGGGGAAIRRHGKAGTAYSHGLDGLDNRGSGGTDGNGGTHDGTVAYPGGGAFSDGAGGCPGKAGFQNKVPVGGMGGSKECGGNDRTQRGGFGFGGGGSAMSKDDGNGGAGDGGAGGGGGGYSGGGGGKVSIRWDDCGSGGGGGSYANENFIFLPFLQSFDHILYDEPRNGYASYRFTNNSPIRAIRLSMDTSKCIDDNYAASILTGNNVQLASYEKDRSPQWVIDGASIKIAANLDKCIDLDHSNTANGTNIQLWDCNGTGAQKWIYDVANQAIRSVLDFNKCMDLTQSNTAVMTNIQLFNCNGTGAQKWFVDGLPSAMPSGTNQRIHLYEDRDKCVDIKAAQTANGTNIQLYHCHTANNSQYFTFDGRQIKMQAAPDKCIGPDPTSPPNAINVVLATCTDNNLQEWIYDGFSKAFRSAVNTNMCLDVYHSSTADGTNIQLFECNGTDAQQFEIY